MKKKKNSSKKHVLSKKYSKGALGAGFAYAVLALLIILAAGSAMIGNIAPSSKSPENGQSVIVTTNTPEPSKSNLQLYTFPGVTFTPTPTPTPIPQPQQNGGGDNGHGGGHGSGGGSTCFPAGTQILMANGSEENIENIKIGDKVTGYNGQKQVIETVLATESPIRDHLYKLSLADGTSISLTREHPLYTQNGWSSISPASTLEENPNLHVHTMKIGDKVLKSNGQYVEIEAMEYIPGNVQTYNLKTVTGYNDFYADNVLAHNKGGGGGGGGGGSGGGSAR